LDHDRGLAQPSRVVDGPAGLGWRLPGGGGFEEKRARPETSGFSFPHHPNIPTGPNQPDPDEFWRPLGTGLARRKVSPP